MTVLSAAFFVEFISALADLVLDLLRVASHCRRWFSRSIAHEVTLPLGQNYARTSTGSITQDWCSKVWGFGSCVGFERKRRVENAPLGDGVRSLGHVSERCRVPKLRQERVLIVVATARYNLPLLIEVTDFAEPQRHPASSLFASPGPFPFRPTCAVDPLQFV